MSAVVRTPAPGAVLAPLCRYCGKPIAKRTVGHFTATRPNPDWRQGINDHPDGRVAAATNFVPSHLNVPLAERPATREAVQARTNEAVVSIKYRTQDGVRFVDSYSTWDRESYADPFFCSGSCRHAFVDLMETAGCTTHHYNDALAKQRAVPA